MVPEMLVRGCDTRPCMWFGPLMLLVPVVAVRVWEKARTSDHRC